MKQINKALLDELMRLERKYWKTHDTDILPYRIEMAKRLSEQAFGNQDHWLGFSGIVDSILGGKGLALKSGATNAVVYKVLEVLGFEVVEDAPEQEAANEN